MPIGDTFSFTPSEDYTIDPQNLPTGVTVDSTTGTVTVDTSEVDTIGFFQEFGSYLFGKASEDYIADSAFPNLNKPDENPSDGPKPYDGLQQFLVRQVFARNTKALVYDEAGITNQQAEKILQYILTGKGDLTPEEALIAADLNDRATTLTQSQVGLPSTWTMNSTDEESWTPSPPDPYNELEQGAINQYFDEQLNTATESYITSNNLTEEQMGALKSAIESGVVPMPDTLGIKSHYEAIQQAATELTQAEFGLPSAWFRGTADISNWTPVNLNPITAARVNILRTEMLTDNVATLVDDLSTKIKNQLEELDKQGIPANDPTRVALSTMLEFLKAVSDSIRELKAALKEIQRIDAEQSENASKGKFSALGQRRSELDEQFATDKEVAEKEKEQQKFALAMKILGPLIAAITAIIGVLITIATLGLASPLGAALIGVGIALGATMVAYSIADSITGCSQQFIEAFKSWLDSVVQNIEPAWLASLVKSTIVIAITAPLMVLLLVSMATGSGAGTVAAIASQAAIQASVEVGKQLVKVGIQQIVVQLLMLLLMGSNALPELVGNIVKELGGSKEVKLAMEILMMVLMVVLVAVALGKGQAAGTKIAEGIEKVAEKITPQIAKTAAQEVVNGMTKAMESLGKFMQATKDRIPGAVLAKLEGFLNAMTSLKSLRLFEQAFLIAGPLAEAVGGIAIAVIHIQLYQLQKDLGELEASEQLLNEIIRLFQKLVQSLLNGISANGDFLTTLNQFMNSMYASADQNIGKLFAQSQAA